ncbi:hypothetical protein B0H63DRAFT_556237 [Podospora didyma]|uniref:SnoaL-like domain-containing protein n=1 Tax=Podospora didyma TaxID=330526 RepID=A0AAE0P869_9PEZI|nr:hypothetical protein B0H63DRAFT_556237 [Podospora didyma]
MSSYPTEPVFIIHAEDWQQQKQNHPLMQYLHKHKNMFDAQDFDACTQLYTPDFKFTKSTGETFHGKHAVDAFHSEYEKYGSHEHEVKFGVIIDTPDGYVLWGQCDVFVDLPGHSTSKKAKDSSGRDWDCVAHLAFQLDIQGKGDSECRYKSLRFFVNPLPVALEAIKRGLLTAEDAVHGRFSSH